MISPVQVLRSAPGTKWTYWTGVSLYSARLRDERLDMLAAWLFHASTAGYVKLFQRRLGNGDFAFEAVRTSLSLTPEQDRLLTEGSDRLREYGRPHADVELAGALLLGEQTPTNAVVAWAAHLGSGGKAKRCKNYGVWRLECPGGGSPTGRHLHRPRIHVAAGAQKQPKKKQPAVQ